MTKKIKLLMTFTLLCICQMLKAQTVIDTASLINIALESDYIIEGRIIDICTYKGIDGGIYHNNIIEISKIGKGNLQCGTVSLITNGGELNGEIGIASHNTEFTIGFTGVFFLKDNNTEPLPTNNCILQLDNSNSLILERNEQSYLGYYTDYVNSIVEGVNCQFKTLQEFYDFIQINSPYGLINCTSNKIKSQLENYEIEIKNQFVNNPYIKVKQKKTRSNNLQYEFSNPTITGNSTKFYEFDLNVFASNDSTYLDECAVRIKYNPLAHGTNIASSIIATLGTNFSSTTYNNIQKIDKTDSVVSIWIHQAVGGQLRTKVDTFPKLLLHLKFPFIDCGKYPKLFLDTFATILNFSFYTIANNSTSASAIAYNSVILNDTLLGILCYPEITSVTSKKTGTNSTGAGVGDTITVKGKHFGVTDSLAAILLPNADDGGSTMFPIQKYDYLPNGWSDTMIKFRLNSYFDSTDNNLIQINGYANAVPGGGQINIRNKYKLKDTNAVSSNNLF
jgi:hypothetical protein